MLDPRDVGTTWLYRGRDRAEPMLCTVVERYDDLPKEMRDVCIRFADGKMIATFDCNLHAHDCTGPTRDVTQWWNPAKEWETREPKCPCGALPIDPQHKWMTLGRTKHKLQTKAEIEHEDLVVNFDEPTPKAVGRKAS